MSLEFSNRISAVKPSAIREILKMNSIPEIISFSAGNPSSQSFNIPVIKQIIDEIFMDDPVGALQYSVSEGMTQLREVLKTRIGILEQDELIITSGAQQAIELATKSLVNEGDTVICEDPTFVASINTFKTYNANLVGISSNESGLDLFKLEKTLIDNKNTKIIYLIPNFQNPTGSTMSLEKRRQIYELAVKYKTRIIEDDPYGEIRFTKSKIPSIKSIDTENIVIYVGSMSKVFSSGMRVGYVACSKELMAKIIVAKQVSDVHTNILAQKICCKFITEHDFGKYINELQELYKNKRDLMVACMEKYLSPKIGYVVPSGGIFLWCRLPENADGDEFCKTLAEKYKVAIVPGSAFNVTSEKKNYFRLNYSTPSDKDIVEGIKRLGEFSKLYL